MESVLLSKLLSYVLRHKPGAFGLVLDAAGWVEIDVLLSALGAHGRPASREELLEVVRSSSRQRFAVSPDGSKIRASHGHSLNVDLGHEPATPPRLLFHGTIARFIDAIRNEGLKRGQRRHVHLSETVELAASIGARRGRPLVLTVRALDLHATGQLFFRAPNGVWLTDGVPAAYIDFSTDR